MAELQQDNVHNLDHGIRLPILQHQFFLHFCLGEKDREIKALKVLKQQLLSVEYDLISQTGTITFELPASGGVEQGVSLMRTAGIAPEFHLGNRTAPSYGFSFNEFKMVKAGTVFDYAQKSATAKMVVEFEFSSLNAFSTVIVQ